MKYNPIAYGLLCLCALSSQAFASDNLKELSNLSFEDLGDVVTSVSKRPEQAFQAPGAIYVISQEDIRHSGMRSIPELLRMVPGLQIAQSDPKVWANTSRGFNSDGFGNKLLVLIDGRTVYTPLFSGVYWDVQDVMLEDIERIEVIRGPGASLWGANAVNGVINIITKSAKDTQTTVASVGVGKETKAFGEARYGGTINNNMYYRMYGKRSDMDSSKTVFGTDGGNDWDANRTGFRVDWKPVDEDNLTFQGDLYENHQNLSLYLPNATAQDDDLRAFGGNFLTKWEHNHENDGQSVTKLYYDAASSHYSLLAQDNYTMDADYQYTQPLGDRHIAVVGAGYRYITDELRGSDLISYAPTSRERSLYSMFAQDTYKLVPDKLHITLGSKFEHNDFTGFEYQPSARVGWYPTQNQTVWASVSRSVRTPNRSEDDLSLVILPGYIRWLGNRDFESEKLMAYELGYRLKPTKSVVFDTTFFVNDYNDLRTNELSARSVPADTIVGLEFDNKAKAQSYGFEIASDWSVTDYWTLKAAYTFLQMDVDKMDNSTDSVVEQIEGNSPKNQFNIRSLLYLPYDIEWSNSLYYVDNLSAPLVDIPAYLRFDTRVAWKPKQGLELSLVGQNLFDSAHPEFSQALHGVRNEIERNVYGMVTVRF